MLNGELNPQLGRIPEVREIDAHLRDKAFRRRLFGCDFDEVQDCLAEITKRYKAIIASLVPLQGQEWQMQELQERIAQMSQESAALNSGFHAWARWYEQANAALQAENDQLRQEVMGLWETVAQKKLF